MKKYYSISLLLLICILTSCATIFESNKQTVQINIPSNNLSLYIDSNYIGSGEKLNVELNKNLHPYQLRIFSKDKSKKDYNKVLLQNNYSPTWYYNFGLAGAFLITGLITSAPYNGWFYYLAPGSAIGSLIDLSVGKATKFNDSYDIPELKTYNYHDSSKKKIYLKDLIFDFTNKLNINEPNFVVRDYPSGSLPNIDKPSFMKRFDSLDIPTAQFSNELNSVLLKLKFTDSILDVFIDNINSYNLRCTVKKLIFNKMLIPGKNPGTADLGYFEHEIETNWILENIYGDTIYNENINSKSGQYSIQFYHENEARSRSMSDCIENTLLDFLKIINDKKYIEKEIFKTEFTDLISIKKPGKSPSKISEAMNATVTIKNNDSHGSGFLISNDGYIVTNFHVISQNESPVILLNDGTEVKAKVIRNNKFLDLSLLKIEGTYDYAFLIPNNQNYKTADEILAIGTPKSIKLGQSVSKGIISGDRKSKGMNFVQTDIAINPGNSGGPIILTNGELIGIIEYKLIGNGTERISFSIPAFDIFKNLGLSY